jgi:hypothetical protein
MAKKIITIGKKGVTERIEGNGPVNVVNIDYPNGSASSDSGKTLSDRKQPMPITKDGSSFSAFEALFGDLVSGTFTPYSPSAGDNVIDVVLFCSDSPAILHGVQIYSGNIFVNTSQIINGGSVPFVVRDEQCLLANSNDSPFATNPSENFGNRSEFETSNGIKCWGYPVLWIQTNFGYLQTSGGTRKYPNTLRIECISNGSRINGLPAIAAPSAGVDGTPRSIIINEDAITNEILQNPRIKVDYLGNSLVDVVGFYSVR